MTTNIDYANPARRSATKTLGVLAAVLATCGAGLLSGTAGAAGVTEPIASYPSKSVRLIVPFAAGGGTDIQARITAQEIGKLLGQSFIVENRPGAGGNIGAQFVASQPGDGYTLLVGSTGTHVANQYLYSKLPFDPVKDFIPISTIAVFDNAVVVPENSPFKTLKELIDYAKKNPGKLSYGITTVGSSSHLAVEKLKHDTGFDAVAVPYNGAGQATTDLLGGRLDFMLDLVSTQYGSIKAGKVRAIATTALKRNPTTPDVPTVGESGYPEFSAVGFTALFAPAGTPAPVIQKIYQAMDKAYHAPGFQESMQGRGFEFVTMEPAKFAEFLVNERAKYSKVIRDANIKLD
jgi:tripartite-type tricarboxylate transporter receptor subunit TctC